MSLSLGLALGLTRLGGVFNPSSIAVDGVKLLKQQLLTNVVPTGATLLDERSNKGDARDIQQGRCYHFDGVNDWVVVPNNSQIDITNNFSVTIRAKNDLANISGIQSLFGKFESAPSAKRSWALAFDATEKLYLIVSSNGTLVGQYTSTASIALQNAHTYGATFSDGTIKLYVDGVEVAGTVTSGTIPSTIFSGDAPLTFGVVNPSAPVVLWDGQQFDARIYKDAVLTEAEMLAVHNNEEVQYAPVAWYKMDEQDGTIAYDSSGFENHGTITNATLSTFHDTQNTISFQNNVGFSKYMLFDGSDDYVATTLVANEFCQDSFSLEMWIKPTDGQPSSPAVMFGSLDASTMGSQGNNANNGISINVTPSGGLTMAYKAGGNFAQATTQDVLFTNGEQVLPRKFKFEAIAGEGLTIHEWISEAWSALTLDATNNGLFSTNSVVMGDFNLSLVNYIGARNANGTAAQYYGGVVFDINVYADGAQYFCVHGYGNTAADWVDYVGSSVQTINGSPDVVYIPRDEGNITLDVFEQALQFTGEVPYNGLLKQSNCLSLNGTSQDVNLGSASLLNLSETDVFSIRAWFNQGNSSEQGYIISKLLLNTRGWSLFCDGTNDRVGFLPNGNVASGKYSSAVFTEVGQWAQCRFDYDGAGNISFYKRTSAEDDWTFLNTATGLTWSTPTDAEDLVVGNRDGGSSSGTYFDGDLAGIEILDVNGDYILNLPLAEGAGGLAYDASGNGNHGTLVNNPTRALQDVYHYNIVSGFSKYMLFDGSNDYINLGTNIIHPTQDFDISLRYIPEFKNANERIIGQGSTGTNGRFYISSQTSSGNSLRFFIGHPTTNVAIPALTTQQKGVEYLVRVTRVGDLFSLYIDGALQGTQTQSGVSVQVTNTFVGNSANSEFFAGVTSNITFNINGVDVSAYNGYGNTAANWVDLIGSNDGTVVGSPSNIYIPAVSSTLDAFGEALRNPAGAFHNGAETLIDFTGGVASPAAVQGGWEEDWAFNDARTNPLFNRTLTLDSADHRADRFLGYSEVLSGTNLTKVEAYTATKEI